MVTARERIRAAAGTHFDPDVVATFLAMPLDVFETARVRSLDRPTA
jgi:response regulator RpfG family c-di-GMP phosphodiesterase